MMMYLPYAVMFAGGALTSLFDIHSRYTISVMGRHKLACAGFAVMMGVVGMFFFLVIVMLGVLNPNLSPLAASLLLFIGYRFVVQSKFVSLKFGDETKEVGFAWIYDGFIFFFFDYVKSRETKELQGRFMCLPLEDLVALACGHARSADDKSRVQQIAGFQDEQFKKRWLAQFCARAEATEDSEAA